MEEGPGYCHFPDHYDAEYFRQLTAEQQVKKFHKGFMRREWQKMRPRNEALDCRVYAIAALAILNTNVDQLANRYEKQTSIVVPENEVEQTEQNKVMLQRPVRRSSKPNGFVNSWR